MAETALNLVARDNAIAVIGISCRLPKSPDPNSFWRLLRTGRSAISEAPPQRRDVIFSGADRYRCGFLDQIDRFDPDFFGISPREAAMMDPQQRLVLELGWEALEDAGIVPEGIRDSRTGVFVGVIWDDYATLLGRQGVEAYDHHSLTGTQRAIIANRLSYTLGLRGPSLTVDTAQSSSLVAVHVACESLRRGESTLALVGGVNLIVAPESTAGAASMGGLSPDSRCFTFDSRANGYARGEGGGLVVLKPLSRAVEDGDSIYCVIRGSAVNNDGGTNGLTVPSVRAQAEVLRRAYQQAGVDPAEVQYVELHGTGTRVGDPIEAAALGAALGTARSSQDRLTVGSAKTNVGHLEGAAGIVGLLKTILSLRHREIPPSLNFETPNPSIDLDALNLRVQVGLTPWPHIDRPLVAGVSSFGMGGTNCHVVLSAVEHSPDVPDSAGDPVVPWVISARNEPALRAQARNLARLARSGAAGRPVDIAHALATTRTHFSHRAAVVATHAEEFATALEDLATGRPNPAVLLDAEPSSGSSGTVFVFPGQGGQWPGMGRRLYAASPVFREHLDACAEALAPFTDWSLLDVLHQRDGAPSLDRVDVVQPALFAIMVALARLWQHHGIH
ncbi:type I polyketide synthase, partial [Nonomuraea sp. NPDC050643]|uniref:type I polyketide synthase n=1 Tax=Nonomuraea sp. NPDC050643 TaxID=3155660 RepID=UPI0033C0C31E